MVSGLPTIGVAKSIRKSSSREGSRGAEFRSQSSGSRRSSKPPQSPKTRSASTWDKNVDRWRGDGGRFAKPPDTESTMIVETHGPVMGNLSDVQNESLGGYGELQRIGEITNMIESAMQNMGAEGQLQIQLERIRIGDLGHDLDVERTRLVAMVQSNPKFEYERQAIESRIGAEMAEEIDALKRERASCLRDSYNFCIINAWPKR
mgnify:CR=1 FL=1